MFIRRVTCREVEEDNSSLTWTTRPTRHLVLVGNSSRRRKQTTTQRQIKCSFNFTSSFTKFPLHLLLESIGTPEQHKKRNPHAFLHKAPLEKLVCSAIIRATYQKMNKVCSYNLVSCSPNVNVELTTVWNNSLFSYATESNLNAVRSYILVKWSPNINVKLPTDLHNNLTITT